MGFYFCKNQTSDDFLFLPFFFFFSMEVFVDHQIVDTCNFWSFWLLYKLGGRKQTQNRKREMTTAHPSLYQVNTRILLAELSIKLNRNATLDDIPDNLIEDWSKRFDWVWFLGAWQTGEKSREVSRSNQGLHDTYAQQLPGYKLTDVSGSPFAISCYELHSDFGDSHSLIHLQKRKVFQKTHCTF